MNGRGKPGTILIAEDDEEDLLLAQEALEECQFTGEIRSVQDGVELMDYLHCRGSYRRTRPARPDLILLDLRMPKKDGYEALQEIRADVELRFIPVVILSVSRAVEDIHNSYTLGANSYIAKPDEFEVLVEALRTLEKYWFGVVSLPYPNGEYPPATQT